MTDFLKAIKFLVAPRLEKLGYQYSDVLRDRDLRYGFYKPLGQNIYAIIFFRRGQYEERPDEYRFAVELTRRKATNLDQWYPGNYEGGVQEQLTHVVRYFYGIEDTAPQHWWHPIDEEELNTTLIDIGEQLEKYGTPWLEDPESKGLLDISKTEEIEFQEALYKIVAPELEAMGYKLIVEHDIDFLPSCFSKKLWNNLTAYIIFGFRKHPGHPKRFAGVHLCRTASSDPFDPNWVYYDTWLQIELGQLLWLLRNLPIDKPGRPQEREWQFQNMAELETVLNELVNLLRTYGIPWLEDPNSKLS